MSFTPPRRSERFAIITAQYWRKIALRLADASSLRPPAYLLEYISDE